MGKTSRAQTAFAVPMCEGREPVTVALLVTCEGIRAWAVLQPLGVTGLITRGLVCCGRAALAAVVWENRRVRVVPHV